MSASSADAESFRRLVSFLCRNEEPAGEAYERVRGRLCRFFQWRGLRAGDALADETLDRVARKLAAGEVVTTSSPAAYVMGVARLVGLEAIKQEIRERRNLERAQASAESPDPDAENELRLQALEACLKSLAEADRLLLLDYHRGDGAQRIQARQELAQRLGVAVNALRIRVHRLRLQLEACVKARLGGRNGSAETPPIGRNRT